MGDEMELKHVMMVLMIVLDVIHHVLDLKKILSAGEARLACQTYVLKLVVA